MKGQAVALLVTAGFAGEKWHSICFPSCYLGSRLWSTSPSQVTRGVYIHVVQGLSVYAQIPQTCCKLGVSSRSPLLHSHLSFFWELFLFVTSMQASRKSSNILTRLMHLRIWLYLQFNPLEQTFLTRSLLEQSYVLPNFKYHGSKDTAPCPAQIQATGRCLLCVNLRFDRRRKYVRTGGKNWNRFRGKLWNKFTLEKQWLTHREGWF